MFVKLLISIVIGAVVGWAAGKLMKYPGSLLRNILLGIAGSALGGFVGGLLKVEPTSWIVSMILAIGCSCLLLWLYRKLFKKRKKSSGRVR